MAVEIEFYGAAGEVTGSCHVLRANGHTVLLDCGLIQGGHEDERRNHDPFPFSAADIDAVVLSHAHLDHSGRLPLLVKRGFRGPIHVQEASGELCAILLADAAQLEERDAEYLSRKTGRQVKPLYTLAEGSEVMRQMRGVRYREEFEVVPGVRARFRDAGHILGSSSVELSLAENGLERKMVFSGDLGQYDTPILKDPHRFEAADLVLMESTYGDRRHRGRDDTERELGAILAQAARDGGNILIPAFAIGRFLWKGVDGAVIDGTIDGTAKSVMWGTGRIIRLQTGYVYHYAFAMLIGVAALLTYFILTDSGVAR